MADPVSARGLRILRDELRGATRSLARDRRFTLPALAALGLGTGAWLAVLDILTIESLAPLVVRGSLVLDLLRPAGESALWPGVERTPPDLQAGGLDALWRMLLVLGGLAFGVAALHIAVVIAGRAIARVHDLAVRAALGASPARLGVHRLVGGLLLGSLGLGLGLIVGIAAGAWMRRSWPGGMQTVAGPSWPAAATAVLGLVAIVLLAAALGSNRRHSDAGGMLGVGARATPGRAVTSRLDALVVLQIALTTVLLTAGGLLVRSTLETPGSVGPAPRAATGVLVGVDLPAAIAADPAGRSALYERILARMDSMSGAEAETLSTPGTHVGLGAVALVTARCGSCSRGGVYVPLIPGKVRHFAVSPGFFEAMGTGIVAGREFDRSDGPGGAPVALVNEAMAAEYFERGEPIGRRVQVGGARGRWHTVVGVVPDLPVAGLGAALVPGSAIYVPVLQSPPLAVDATARVGSGDELSVLGAELSAVIAAADDRLELASPVPMKAYMQRHRAPARWFGRAVLASALLLLGLATHGVSAAMRMNVVRRRREIAVRLALGASPIAVVGWILRQALGLIAVGAGIGLLCAPGVASALRPLEPNLRVFDPTVYGAVTILLVAAALAGGLLSARRAAGTAPSEALAA